MDKNIPALGAIERVPDPRDFSLGTVSPNLPYPAVFIQDLSNLAVEHQKKIPACGSHAGAFLKNVQESAQTNTPQRKSPMFLWKKIKLTDGHKPEDGTDMLSIFKTLNRIGVCDYSLMGNNTDLTLEAYTDASDITPAMESNAKNALIKENGYAFIFSPSMEQIKRAIYDFKAVLVLIRIGDEFWTPSWAEKDILPLRPPKKPVGGHFVVAHSYDDNHVYFRNEWGSTWGRGGDGYFGADYLPFVTEIGTAFDMPNGKFNLDMFYGMASFDVLALQKYLVKNNFGSFVPTGFFGIKTFEAVKKFQSVYGIQQTGYVGILTRTKLNQLT